MMRKVQRCEKIIQFGEGGFLRAFADWIIQLTDEASDFNASAVVVQPIERGMCAQLEAQNCVYTLFMRGMRGGVPTVESKIIDVISRTVEPYRDWNAYLALASQPSFRFVISNTTEAGIEFSPSDRMEDAPRVTFPGKLALLLRRRFELGLPGFIFLPCELIEHNGAELKRCVLAYARLWNFGAAFETWLETENIFCSTLVDRIVTGYPKDERIELPYEDHMIDTSELFHLWVIEGPAEVAKEFPFAAAKLNVLMTDDLERYRTRKVRILNGAHTAMIPYAMLEGVETVGDCMKDSVLSDFVKKCVYDEIIPTLDLGREELLRYADDVFERFCNPYIRHLCASIALNSVSKFKVRVLPSILEYNRRFGRLPEHLVTSFAKLIAFYKTDKTNDDPAVTAFMKRADVPEILANEALWGEDLSFLADAVTERLS